MFRFGEVTGFLLGPPSPPPVRPRRRASAGAIQPANLDKIAIKFFRAYPRAPARPYPMRQHTLSDGEEVWVMEFHGGSV